MGILSAVIAAPQGAIVTNPPLIRQARLLTASGGWMLVGDHLLESNSLGQSWKDITPNQVKRIENVFFLDRSTGWAVLVPGTEAGVSLSVAKTVDGGASWAVWPFRGEGRKYFLDIYAGLASITFVDASHGWLLLTETSSSNFSFGDLFSTDDGGQSWVQLPNPPIAGALRFISPTVGWLQGGPGDFDLYVTRDSGRTWRQQKMLARANVPAEAETYYSLPDFAEGPNHDGVLAVNFAAGIHSSLAAYISSDAGQNWRPAASEANIPEGSIAVDIVDQKVIRMFRMADLTFNVGALGAGQLVAQPPASAKHKGVSQITFSDPEHGWAILSGGYCHGYKKDCYTETALWATTDGGHSFVDRTPPLVAPERLDQPTR